MSSRSSLRRLWAIAVLAVVIAGSGCGESRPTPTSVQNVEHELKKIIAPPGAYVSALVGHRFVKMSQPAMRIKRVAFNDRGELEITFVALRGGEEKTDTVPLSEEEATHLRKLKSVLFVLGGEKQTEVISITEKDANP